VVTEHGVAYLHGKSIRERAQALIEIAHPKFRDELYEYCEKWDRHSAPQSSRPIDHSPETRNLATSLNYTQI